MAGDSTVNIAISQGSAVKEMYNVKKQTFEMQQQMGTQERIEKHREEKIKIQKFENNAKIQAKGDENREGQGHFAKREEEKNEKQDQADENRSNSSFVDIIV